jgi:acyl-CoA reductase-like NAD-dependent aldehyde dehydrogenase
MSRRVSNRNKGFLKVGSHAKFKHVWRGPDKLSVSYSRKPCSHISKGHFPQGRQRIRKKARRADDICVSIAGLIQVASESAARVVNEGCALLLKEPWGVVLAIAPWNAPYVLGVRAILTPLAM